MNKRLTGTIFCCTGLIPICTWYMSAAVYGSNPHINNSSHFQMLLDSVGYILLLLSILFLTAGITYLVIAEKESKNNRSE